MPVKTAIRSLTSWKTLAFSTAAIVVALVAAFWAVELRSFALAVGFAAALIHFWGSAWLWRSYMDGGADFDSPDAYVPSGLSKSTFMFGAFIALLTLSVLLAIADAKGP